MFDKLCYESLGIVPPTLGTIKKAIHKDIEQENNKKEHVFCVSCKTYVSTYNTWNREKGCFCCNTCHNKLPDESIYKEREEATNEEERPEKPPTKRRQPIR